MSRRTLVNIALAVILIAGTVLMFSTASQAYQANGQYGFPLDDPWIHLQFAQNLHHHGTFSYYQDQQVTSGSTSPLYTFLLAFAMVFTDNEFVLSYILGGIFLVVSGLAMFRLAERLFHNRLVSSLAAALLVITEPRLIWVSLSGMETTMFIALLIVVMLFYVEKRTVLLGISAGLLVWTRPEALMMIGILMADAVYHASLLRREAHAGRTPWFLRSLLVAGAFIAAYAVFNLSLSGSFFPNTFAAKLKYYGTGGVDFPSQVLWFLSAGHMIVIAPFAVAGVLAVVITLIRRKPVPLLPALLWCVGMFVAYWWKLPYLYQYGRYLMPILPFVVLLALEGLDELLKLLEDKVGLPKGEKATGRVRAVVLLAMVGFSVVATWDRRAYYSESCRYISDRQVATATWVRDHLPEDAIVATHDVGALAYYSDRRIVDMVGLISPEMINHIGRLDKLMEYLRDQHVTHLAVLRTWFEITNIHPLFMTDELRPEVMEVFVFDPERMHFANKTASILSERGRLELASGNVQQAGAMLEQALAYDANSARIHLLLGRALMLVGRLDEAEREFGAALSLQPDLWDARFGRADLAARRQDPREAIRQLEELVDHNPSYRDAYQALAQLYYRSRIDTAKASFYLRRYNDLTPAPLEGPLR